MYGSVLPSYNNKDKGAEKDNEVINADDPKNRDNAGFNPLTIISEKTGKSISQLKDEMSAGAITVDMVFDAFASATAEGGGKFNGMLERQRTNWKSIIRNSQKQ
jgi:hypothetical protein